MASPPTSPSRQQGITIIPKEKTEVLPPSSTTGGGDPAPAFSSDQFDLIGVRRQIGSTTVWGWKLSKEWRDFIFYGAVYIVIGTAVLVTLLKLVPVLLR
jgi:hypothetical protein